MNDVPLNWTMLFLIPGIGFLAGLGIGRWWVLPLPIGLWWLYWVGTDQGWWGISPADGWLFPFILWSTVGVLAAGAGVTVQRRLRHRSRQ